MAISTKEAKQRLIARGETTISWAKKHGFSVHSVRAVLAGHNKGRYGHSHDIAVKLGVKDEPK